ncbi:MAG: fatty acid desaturase [Myxococcota bacterium]|jgi:fatty acid desaturase
MSDQTQFSDRLDRAMLAPLQIKTDGPGLWRALLHVGLLVAADAGLVLYGLHPIGVILALIAGFLTSALFAPFHECIHNNAFKTRWMNRVLAWVCALPLGFFPSGYSAFHFEHHHHTHDPKRDPELLLAPERLVSWPSGIVAWVLTLSGVLMLIGRVVSLPLLAANPSAGFWERLAPYASEKKRVVIVRQARIALLIYIAVGAGMVLWPPLAMILIPTVLSGAFLAFFQLPEHAGLATEGSIFHRTRSIRTNAVVNLFWWNMSYHAEHHAYMAVPFYHLPALSRLLEAEMCNVVADGYLSVYRKALGGDPQRAN